MNPRKPQPAAHTDWARVAAWYDQLVGDQGSEYHREVVLPGTLRLLALSKDESVLDVACGQGVLCRLLHQLGHPVAGLDAARPLIEAARRRSEKEIEFMVLDAVHLSEQERLHGRFDAVSCILAIQNIHPAEPVFHGVAACLKPGGRFVMVMNHPAFRGPHFTSWGWDEQDGVQYRRVDRYLLPRREPIYTNPGTKSGEYTWSFHRPLQHYVRGLSRAGLLIDAIEEWPSHKVSTSGPRAKAENVSRKEIPLFMAIRAIKTGAA